jgi:hypothetical protein
LGAVFVNDLSHDASIYHANTRLTLSGSDWIHLPATEAKPLELLSQAIHAQCSTFVTLPALDALYFWTGEDPSPNWFNLWLYGNGALQQQAVHGIKTHDPSRFCVVYSGGWLELWNTLHVPQLPLTRLVERFTRESSPPQLFEPGGYQLFVSQSSAP